MNLPLDAINPIHSFALPGAAELSYAQWFLFTKYLFEFGRRVLLVSLFYCLNSPAQLADVYLMYVPSTNEHAQTYKRSSQVPILTFGFSTHVARIKSS